MTTRILLVEDERDMSLIVADTLRQQGYDVTVAYDGIEGLAKFKSDGADLIVADIMMPRLDGFAMAREIRRATSQIPIIFLTAKSSIDDIETGFELGANDYLKKPFEFREFLIRIKALLRGKTNGNGENRIYAIGKYRFDTSTQLLTFNDKETVVSNIEARILEKLAANTGKTVDATELMLAVWQRDEPSNRNSLHGYIHKLRKALSLDPDINIVNQRGFGYMLTVRN